MVDQDVALKITEPGMKILEKLWPIYEKIEKILLVKLSESDKKHLRIVLNQLGNNALSMLHKDS